MSEIAWDLSFQGFMGHWNFHTKSKEQTKEHVKDERLQALLPTTSAFYQKKSKRIILSWSWFFLNPGQKTLTCSFVDSPSHQPPAWAWVFPATPRHYWGLWGLSHMGCLESLGTRASWSPYPWRTDAVGQRQLLPLLPLTPGQTSRWRLVHHRLGAQPQGNPFTLDRSLIRSRKKNSIYNGVGPGPIL